MCTPGYGEGRFGRAVGADYGVVDFPGSDWGSVAGGVVEECFVAGDVGWVDELGGGEGQEGCKKDDEGGRHG